MSLDTKKIEKEIEKELQKVLEIHDMDLIWRKYLGRKGYITKELRELKNLPEKQKRKEGEELNNLKEKLNDVFNLHMKHLKERSREESVSKEWLDVSRPSIKKSKGNIHPITKTIQEMRDIFGSMGFETVDGPEIEDDWHNFEALNIPSNHPARDLWDTFWLKPKSDGLLLRTHTSPAQIRYMKENSPPFRIVVPGRVFRYEATDASHEIQFYHLEGLMVNEGQHISVANFRAVINEFLFKFFKREIKIRLRPGYFPFVEPGFEVDISCIPCEGAGCPVCSHTGWLEIMGAGMVHPKVFKAAGYNPKNLTGFAFGIGLDRLAMMKYRIEDMRLFHSGDIRFLQQFK